ncbi:MAG: hypothetical protein IPM72_01185 [Chitinophagaceae bacterium]|nr:hypothetical protein [Chitinophagaceae bacterium]
MRNNGIKVSLDGHGADEMLFGYPDMIYEWASTEKNEEAALQLSHTWYQIMGSENQGLLRHIPTKSEIRSKSFASKLYNNLTPSSLKTYYRKIQHKKIGRNSMLPFFGNIKTIGRAFHKTSTRHLIFLTDVFITIFSQLC